MMRLVWYKKKRQRRTHQYVQYVVDEVINLSKTKNDDKRVKESSNINERKETSPYAAAWN